MLKSTHKSASSAQLPPWWTEHKAPTGHVYYYNSETKQSTYTRPTLPAAPSPPPQTASNEVPHDHVSSVGGIPFLGVGQQPASAPRQSGDFRGGRSYQDRNRRRDDDRPKSKHIIPGAEPWILVKTKYGRRFVYHPEKSESFWKFPQDVLLAVFELDRVERDKQEQESVKQVVTEPTKVEPQTQGPLGLPVEVHRNENRNPEDSDSYEEVEVTDDEGEGEPKQSKKQKTDGEDEGIVDFDEADIEYQLAAMCEDYDLDPDEHGAGGSALEEGIGISKEDSTALFRDLLDDFRINPYTTWEAIIEEGRIIDDDRYTLLPNMRTRKEVFTEWSTDRIQELKERRRTEEKKDPRIAYLRFLHEYATPKLYWPEFKRKYRTEVEMRDNKLVDKDRERLYRDHVARLKLPENTRKSDLTALLRSIPLQSLNQSTSIITLPSRLLTDVKFISLPARTRDSLVEAYIATLPSAPELGPDALSAEEQIEADRRKTERDRREKAMADREKLVQDEKRKQRGALRHGMEMLRDGEVEIDRAMKIKKDGLRAYAPEDAAMEEGEATT